MVGRSTPRARWWLVAALVMLMGLVPVFAFRSLGSAGDFAILGDTVQSSGTGFTIDVNAVTPGGGAGAIGANTFNVDGGITTTVEGGIVSPLTGQLAAAQAAFTSFQTEANATGTVIPDQLGGQTLTPGVYRTAGIALVTTADLTLDGPGDYLIYGNGGFGMGAGRTIVLINGANAANVYLVSNGNMSIDDAGAVINGNFLTSSTLAFSSPSVLNGKLVSLQTVLLEGGAGQTLTVNDFGAAPTITKSPDDADNDLVVCVGDNLTYTLTADDPDPGTTELSLLSATPALPGTASHVPGLPTTGDPASTTFSFTPVLADVGTYTLVYRAEDQSAPAGTINERTITIRVVQAPVITLSNFAGQTSGAGTPGDPYLICPDDAFSYDFSATDGDGGDAITLSVTGAPASGVHAPSLPTTQASPINGTFDYTPTDAENGQTFTVTYSATDSFGCDAADQTVVFRILDMPTFQQPTDLTYQVCVGDTLQYDLLVVDNDAGDLVQLSVEGTPVGAFHAPNVFGTDGSGPGGGDILDLDNPVVNRLEWLPTAGDVGLHTLTYTAIDNFGCTETLTVMIEVSQRPVFNSPPTPADGEELEVCVGDTLTYDVSATDPDADLLDLAATGVPANLTHAPGLPIIDAAGTAATTATFIPSPAQAGQTFSVIYTATDPIGCDETTEVRIRVTSPPVFNLPTVTTISACVGDELRIPVRASDADGDDVVTLTSSALPGGATLEPALPATGNPVSTDIVWTPAAAGSSVITFTATDTRGCDTTQAVTINVSNLPTVSYTAPAGGQGGTGTVADPVRVCVGDALTYTVNANSNDAGQSVNLSVTDAPAGLGHVPGLPTSGTPTTSAVATFTPAANQGGQTFTVTYTATDGTGAGCNVSTTLTIEVSNRPVFNLPSASPATFNVCVGTPLTFEVRASDADTGDVVTLSSTALPAGATMSPALPVNGNPASSTFSWTPAAAGASSVTFTATDASGCATTQVVNINASAVPTLAVTPAVGASQGTGTLADPYVVCPAGTGPADTLTYSVTADDTDASQLVTLAETGAPAGSHTPPLPQVSAGPGAPVTTGFSFTPTSGDSGQTFVITYTATDDSGAACSATETVVIQVASLPEFDGGTPADGTVFNVCAGDPVTFRVRASDDDAGDVVTLSHTGGLNAFFTPSLPTTGNPVETVFAWTPGAGAPSTSTLVFTATDTTGCSVTRTITINVSQIPTVVVGAGSGATSGTGTAADPYVVCPPGTAGADTLTYTVTADDTDAAQTVTLSESGSPSGATYTPTLPAPGAAPGAAVLSAFSYTPVAGDAGQTFTITYTATDDFTPACSATATVVIRVSNLPTFDGPTPADGTVINVCAGDPVSFRVHATDADTSDVITLSHSGGLNAFFTPLLPATGNPVETVFNWTPGAGAPATSTLVFTATDTAGCATTRTITINVSQVPTVVVSGVSGASGSGTAADPYVVCPPGTSAADTLTYTVTADDADATQIVTLSEAGSPSAASYTPTLPAPSAAPGDAVVSAFSYTPVAGDAGQTFTITYTATDNFTPACSATTTVVIRVSNLPQITATPNVLNLCVGQSATFRVRATDADGGLVNLSQSNAPASVVFTPGLPLGGNPVETVATFTPTNADAGSRVVTFTATDEDGCAQTTTVTLNVSRVPTVSVSGATGAMSGAGTAGNPYVVCPPGTGPANTLTYNVVAADADPVQTVTLSQTGSPSSATHVLSLPRTGAAGASVSTAFSYTAAAGDAGQTFTITYTATDNFSAACSSTATVVIRVAQLPQFDAPTPADGTVYNVCVGDPVTFRVRASDADAGEQVTLSQSGGLSGFFTPGLPLTGNPVETAFNWTPGAGAPATSTLVFTATDPAGCSVSRTITINVSRVPAVSVSGASGAIRGTGTAADPYVVCPPGTGAADTLTYNVSASDADATQTVTLSQSGSPSSATHTPTLPRTGATGATVNTVFSYTAATADAGQTFTVTYTATDNFSPACSASATVVIRVARLPQFDAPTPGPGQVFNVCAGDPIRFRVKASDGDPGSNVRLTATGVPGAFSLTPTLPASGNPVETEFNWVAVGTGSHTLTFTATDNDGCAVTRTFTINVSAVPTLTVSGISGAQSGNGSEASPLVVCVSPASPLTFTVTGSDVDAADVLTLTQSGKPDGAVLTPNLPHVGTVGAPVSTQFTYSPGTADGGQNSAITFTVTDSSAAQCSASRTVYVRVSHLPVATATPATLTVCEGEEIRYRIRATDQDAGPVTIGTPTIAPAGLTLSHTVGLPAAGNPIETDAVATAPELPANTTFTITYPVTDADGCTTTVVVTVTVLDSEPSSISLSRTGTLAVGSEICYTATVFDNCPPSEGGPRRVPGVPVVFRVTGETGNNELDNTTVITDANGEARLCLTPLFPGTLMVSAAIDLNGDGIGDTGTTGATDTVTIPAPTQDGPACFVSGRGTVEVSEFRDRTSVVLGNFTVDVSPKRNGKLNGKVTFQIPSERFKVQSSKITSMGCSEGPSGKEVVIFGTARVQGIGLVQFRVDALDAGSPGAPGDRFVMTLMDGAGALHGPWGGNLETGGRGRGNRGDISVRIGNLVR